MDMFKDLVAWGITVYLLCVRLCVAFQGVVPLGKLMFRNGSFVLDGKS